jgi:hypothetical protein
MLYILKTSFFIGGHIGDHSKTGATLTGFLTVVCKQVSFLSTAPHKWVSEMG